MGLVDPGGFRATPIFRESRRRALSRLKIVIAGEGSQEVMVRDFSSRGFSAAARHHPPQVDQVVTALLPDGRALWGIVRWVERNVFGVEFDVNSPPDDIEPTTGSEVAIRRQN
jgi:hypothetical protein